MFDEKHTATPEGVLPPMLNKKRRKNENRKGNSDGLGNLDADQ
jgi:hypothetical protein